MNNELENSIKGFKELFDATCHPVFAAIYLYEQRTKNVVKLDGLQKTISEQNEEVDNDLTI